MRELSGVFHGETLGYYDGCDSQQVEQAHQLVADLLADEEEPFDAILANSQGASLAISYLLHQQIRNPDNPLPFHFAVFFTPGIIVSPDHRYKDKEIRSFLDKLDESDINKILVGLLDKRGKAMIEPEKFTGLHNLFPRERELCLNLVCSIYNIYNSPTFSNLPEGPTNRNTSPYSSKLQCCRNKRVPRFHSICRL